MYFILLYFMHLNTFISEKGSVGFTRLSTGVHGTKSLRTPALEYAIRKVRAG